MSPLKVTLTDLIENLDTDLPDVPALTKITEAEARAHTLGALGDQLIGHYVAIAKSEGASWSDVGQAIGVSKQAAQQRHAPEAFSRFTDLSRHAVVLSQEAARSHRHEYIGTEHLLLGLLDEPRGLAVRLLAERGGSAETVRTAVVERLAPEGNHFPRGHIPFSAQGKLAIERAITEAADLGHDFVGTEHLLLGLLAVPDGTAAEALNALGMGQEMMRRLVADAVTELLEQRRTTTDQ
jgi:hypothetical protein